MGHEGGIACPRAFDRRRLFRREAGARIVIGMAEHQEQSFAARFKLVDRMVHQRHADAGALAIGSDRERCQHGGGQALAVLLFDPNAREHEMPEQPAHILGDPLIENAAIGAKRVEKGYNILRPKRLLAFGRDDQGAAVAQAANPTLLEALILNSYADVLVF